jgi:WD40 repeat protein
VTGTVSDAGQLRILRLLADALRIDAHFISRHPQLLFQSFRNLCWWADCPDSERHLQPPAGGWPTSGPPWEHAEPRVADLIEGWRVTKEKCAGFFWLRSLRPPPSAPGEALRAVLVGHGGPVLGLAVSPTNGDVASASEDGTVGRWIPHAGQALTPLRWHTEKVNCVEYSPDGSLIATGSKDGTVCIGEADTGFAKSRISAGGEVRALRFSPDGTWIATVSGAAQLSIWDTTTGKEEWRQAHPRGVAFDGLAVSPDGSRIAFGRNDGTVTVQRALSDEVLVRCRGHESVYSHGDGYGIDWANVWSVDYSPSGKMIASSGADNTVRLWDAKTGEQVSILRGHEPVWRKKDQWRGFVWSVAFSADGALVASAGYDSTVRVWDSRRGVEIACFRGHEGSVLAVLFLPNSQQIISAGSDSSLRIWDVSGGESQGTLVNHQLPVSCLAFSRDGRWLATGGQDNAVMLWDVAQGIACNRLTGHERWVDGVRFSPDDESLASTSLDCTVRIYRWRAPGRVAVLSRKVQDYSSGWDFTPDGRDIVSETRMQQSSSEVVGNGFSWSARGHETELSSGGVPVAWFPEEMSGGVDHQPGGHAWAGSVNRGHHLFILSLEPHATQLDRASAGAARVGPNWGAPFSVETVDAHEELGANGAGSRRGATDTASQPASVNDSSPRADWERWGTLEWRGLYWSVTCRRCGEKEHGDLHDHPESYCLSCGYDGT